MESNTPYTPWMVLLRNNNETIFKRIKGIGYRNIFTYCPSDKYIAIHQACVCSTNKLPDECKYIDCGDDEEMFIKYAKAFIDGISVEKKLRELAENQVEIDPDIAKIIDENFWDML